MSAPAGDQKLNNTDFMAWDNEMDEQPLAITQGETDAEPSNLAMLPPSGLSSNYKGAAPKTAGDRGRNLTSMGQQKRPNSLNLNAPKGRRQSGGNRTAMGKIEQNKYITERDLQLDFDKTQSVARRTKMETANY